MNMMKAKSLCIIFLMWVIHQNTAQPYALHFSGVYNSNGEYSKDVLIVVEDSRIKDIIKFEESVIKNYKYQDLRPLNAIPGLIDVHTHITYYWDKSPGTNPWEDADKLTAPVIVFLAQENAIKTLECGVTTIRDLGSWRGMDLDMQALINRGAMKGPRMYVSGNGLHISYAPHAPLNPKHDPGKADDLDAIAKVVRQELASGVDWIKMYGSTGSDQDVSSFQTYTFEEMKLACDITRLAGKKIAIHAYGAEAARDAIRAGAHSIEHATDLLKSDFELMLQHGTYYVPTVDHNRYYIDHSDEYGYGHQVKENLQNYIQRNFETLKLAIKMNVPIAMGSDAVFTGFGQNTRELGWFVKAGMSPLQALQSATLQAAKLLGKESELGSLSKGFRADIVAIEGDPFQDINAVIYGVKWVMKDGEVMIDKRTVHKK